MKITICGAGNAAQTLAALLAGAARREVVVFAPLGDEAARLVGELAAFFGLDESQLTTRAADAFEILGLDGGEYRTDAEDTDAPRPLLLAEIWPGRLRQLLTREALRRIQCN